MRLARYGSLVLAISVFVAGTAAAEEQAVKFGLVADYYSKYIWRGQNINDKSVLQPTISASAYGFTGSIWGNLDLTNKSQTAPDNAWEFSEFDYSLDYTAAVPDVDWLSFSIGTIHYEFPNTTFKPTTEVYGGLSFGVPLSPSFKWYRDLDEADGSYLQFGLGHTFEKLATWSDTCYCGLQLGASVGWGSSAYNQYYFGTGDGRFNDLTLTAGLPFCIDSWTIKPGINYATLLSDKIRTGRENNDNVWFGVGISTGF